MSRYLMITLFCLTSEGGRSAACHSAFTAELSENRPGTLVDEIFSFVDELDPERVAGEWVEASGQFSPTRFCQAVADMDEIRTQAFLLAIELAEAVEDNDYFIFFPWYQWN